MLFTWILLAKEDVDSLSSHYFNKANLNSKHNLLSEGYVLSTHETFCYRSMKDNEVTILVIYRTLLLADGLPLSNIRYCKQIVCHFLSNAL